MTEKKQKSAKEPSAFEKFEELAKKVLTTPKRKSNEKKPKK
jgi:hypothetical protein